LLRSLSLVCLQYGCRAPGGGGANSKDNIAAACRFCNEQRHRAKVALEPKAYLARVMKRMAAGKWHRFIAQGPTPYGAQI